MESINPNVHTCVEVISSENSQHFERAKADELVVSAELTGALLASAAINHGISFAVADLLTHPGGTEFYSIDPPDELLRQDVRHGAGVAEGQQELHPVAIATGEKSYDINPPSDRKIRPGDRLLVIAEKDRLAPEGPRVGAGTPRPQRGTNRIRFSSRAWRSSTFLRARSASASDFLTAEAAARDASTASRSRRRAARRSRSRPSIARAAASASRSAWTARSPARTAAWAARRASSAASSR